MENDGLPEGISGDITMMLQEWGQGDADALHKVLPLVYEQLRKAARFQLGSERGHHTLEPTALINEVYLRMYQVKGFELSNRAQFFKFAGMLMRRILVDYARAKMTNKRGGDKAKVPLDYLNDISDRQDLDPATMIALDQALDKLKELEPRQARMVELRFFAGLSVEELAEVFEVAAITVKRDFRSAKLWLAKELKRIEQSS